MARPTRIERSILQLNEALLFKLLKAISCD